MKKLIVLIFTAILLICLAGCSNNQDLVLDEIKTYDITTEIKSLDIRFNGADFKIEYGDKFSVESNLAKLEVNENNGTLVLTELTKVKFNNSNLYNDAILTIYVPEGTVFESITLHTGAGRLTVDTLSSENIDFKLGAGEVTINSLVATKSADIEGGAGKITITDGTLHNLDLEMGVGQLNLTATLTGNCSLNSGIGEMNITLLGSKDDYKLELEKGIGNISVDGDSISGNSNIGNGTNEVEIHGGIGAINVKFKDK